MGFCRCITCVAISLQLIEMQKEPSEVSSAIFRNFSSKVYGSTGDIETSQMDHISSHSNPPEVNLFT